LLHHFKNSRICAEFLQMGGNIEQSKSWYDADAIDDDGTFADCNNNTSDLKSQILYELALSGENETTSLSNGCSSFNSDEYSSTSDDDGDESLSLNCAYGIDDTSEFAIHECSYLFGDSLNKSAELDNFGQYYAKRVTFGTVTVREYSLTVGAYSATDECPIQLDWCHNRDKSMDIRDYTCYYESRVVETSLKIGCRRWQSLDHEVSRNTSSSCLHRLSVIERRKRIASVRGMTVEEIQIEEMERSLNQIRRSISDIGRYEEQTLFDVYHGTPPTSVFGKTWENSSSESITQLHDICKLVTVEQILISGE
jgi:hypothetical protein